MGHGGVVRSATRGATALLAGLALLLVGWPTPADAQQVTTSGRQRVLGHTTHERVTVSTPAGTARGDLLRFREADGDVRLA